jgi:hypothetical protein
MKVLTAHELSLVSGGDDVTDFAVTVVAHKKQDEQGGIAVFWEVRDAIGGFFGRGARFFRGLAGDAVDWIFTPDTTIDHDGDGDVDASDTAKQFDEQADQRLADGNVVGYELLDNQSSFYERAGHFADWLQGDGLWGDKMAK